MKNTENEVANYEVTDGVKRCRQCNSLKFTVDFANTPLFSDKKMPVCISCYRLVPAQAYVNQLDVKKKCKACDQLLNLADFSTVGIHAEKSLPHMNAVCRPCASAAFSGVKFGA